MLTRKKTQNTARNIERRTSIHSFVESYRRISCRARAQSLDSVCRYRARLRQNFNKKRYHFEFGVPVADVQSKLASQLTSAATARGINQSIPVGQFWDSFVKCNIINRRHTYRNNYSVTSTNGSLPLCSENFWCCIEVLRRIYFVCPNAKNKVRNRYHKFALCPSLLAIMLFYSARLDHYVLFSVREKIKKTFQ